MSLAHGTAAEPRSAEIREHLVKMLAMAPFDRSPVLRRFLSHVVENALKPDPAHEKEYAIGVEVFDRPDDFDPRVDTIVRVQARRLRDALAQYYREGGKQDRVRLDMPKGHYVLRATRQTPVANDTPPNVDTRSAPPSLAFAASPLPAPRTPLIGRDDELAGLDQRLRHGDVRLLSITGVGGIGKTRLALALAGRVREHYPGGVVFIDLTPVSDRDTLLERLTERFNARPEQGVSLEDSLGRHLHSVLIRPTLLVLDNMEGVLEGADVIGHLLDASQHLHVLVTSRVALRLYGEFEFPLLPLAVPPADWRAHAIDPSTIAAVQLFLDRAIAANPHADFGHDMDALVELCLRLDGLPLAIELVAAQSAALNPGQMLQRFAGHLDLPENPARDAPSRQRTLRRTIDWSFDLLDDDARRLLGRLSVFVGGFTLDAATAVADAIGDLGATLMPSLRTLLAMGMIHPHTSADEPRFTMLETLRSYGRERLAASAHAQIVHKAHAAYFLILAEEGVGTLDVAQRQRWLASCDREQDNFRHALDYLLANGPGQWCLRFGHALFIYWERREKLIEGQRQLQRIVDTVPPETDMALWARIGNYEATMLAFLGNHTGAPVRFLKMLEVYRRIRDLRGEAMTLMALGASRRFLDDESGARDYFAQALETCRRIGDRMQIAGSLSNLADSELKLGNTRAARRLFNEARDMFLAEGDPKSAAWCINHLGDVARREGNLASAASHYLEAEAEFQRLGDAWGLARTKSDRGLLAMDSGDLRQAWPLLLDALARFDALDYRRGQIRLAERLASQAHLAGHPRLSAKLLAAAEAWRANFGYRAHALQDKAIAEHLLRKLQLSLGNVEFIAMQHAGACMTAADVAQAIQSLADDLRPGITRRR